MGFSFSIVFSMPSDMAVSMFHMMGVTQTKICIRMLMISERSLKKPTMEDVI